MCPIPILRVRDDVLFHRSLAYVSTLKTDVYSVDF